MTWAKFCDGFLDHPKVLRAGEDASNLFMRGCIWCNKHLTDGAIPREALRALTQRRDAPALAAKLVSVRLWEETPDGWQVHDWSDHNPTRESVEGRREKTREKVASWREKRGNAAGNTMCNHGCNPVTCEVCNPVRNPVGNPAPDPTRPDPTTDKSTPNGVLPPQPPAGATTAAEKTDKRKPSRPDDAPPVDGSPAAAVVAAVEGAGFLRGLVKRPYALGNAAVAAFPGVDLAAQVAKANGWCVMNPAKAPRSNGDAFLWRWLQTAQNDVANRAAREGQRSTAPDLFAPKAAPTARAVNANDLRREHQSLAALPMRPA